MPETDYKLIRFKQRFENYEKAYKLLDEALSSDKNYSNLEKEGIIQRFEFTYELAWKCLKDYLAYSGVEAKLPRDVIKEAFQFKLISNGQEWINMLEKRNLTAHTYEEKYLQEIYSLLKRDYMKLFTDLYNLLKLKVN